MWSTTKVNETARIQCSEISELFWSSSDLYVTRNCVDGGVWGEVDMSQCTMKNNRSSLIIYSTYLNMADTNFSNYLSWITTEVATYSVTYFNIHNFHYLSCNDCLKNRI